MAPPGPKPAARKRNRKRKRRAAFSSSSSSDEDSSDSQVSGPKKSVASKPAPPPPEDTSSSSSSSSSSSEDSDSDSPVGEARTLGTQSAPKNSAAETSRPCRTPSPTPPPSAVPQFLHPSGPDADAQNEQILKDRFRKFWMASVADAFKDDLEEIRKEPNLTTSRLSILVDSLAAGGEIFTSSRTKNDTGMTEMEIVLDSNA